MKIKVPGCSITKSKNALTIASTITSHIFGYPRQYVQGSFKKCEMYSANLPSHCKDYYLYLSQRFHSEALMLNRELITFTMLL